MRKAIIAAAAVAIALGASPVWAQSKGAGPSVTSKSFTFSTSSHRGRLGVQVMSMTEQLRTFFGVPKGKGVLVAEVQDGTPGKTAGLRAGDVLVSVDGDDVSDVWDVRNSLSDRNKGDQVEVQIVRSKARRKLTAQLDTDPMGAMFRGFKGFNNGKQGKGQGKSFDFDFGFDLDALDDWVGKMPGGFKLPKGALPKQDQKRIEEMERRIKELEEKVGAPKSQPPKPRVPKKPAPKPPASKKSTYKLPTTKT